MTKFSLQNLILMCSLLKQYSQVRYIFTVVQYQLKYILVHTTIWKRYLTAVQ